MTFFKNTITGVINKTAIAHPLLLYNLIKLWFYWDFEADTNPAFILGVDI